MKTRVILGVIVMLCVVAVVVAQSAQETDSCKPSGKGTGVCPPTGTNMGESGYQRAPHPAETEKPVADRRPPPAESAPQTAAPAAEPSTDATAAAPGAGPIRSGTASGIAVDNEHVYVLRGNEVIKLAKNDMALVSTTRLPD